MEYIYCLDTNFFIELWNKHYSPEMFIDFWDKLIDIAKDKKCYIPIQVYEEIIQIDDNVEKYIKRNKDFFVCSYTEEIESNLSSLYQDEYTYNLIDNKKLKNYADIFVLAYAKHYNSIVVTFDGKLINCCKNHNIEYIYPYDFIKKNNFKFIVQN
ncbi:DUF4411 family protein [Brachyspira pilosicoli]|uniref:DUF4411 family protein n=1 Tax=Brachyspira pilosicoli TaxID=52584 RepID=A0A5C8EVN7_BRAPL|nr:DUF4411 family protein [Brachyspira pilosicoli]TXJ41041.1 DUF4411 family protein [Brachyspira pilosicoli]